MHNVAVLNVVGLTPSLIGKWTPNIARFRERGWSVPLEEQFPAVTCTAQAAMLTGKTPSEHGIVANGWYFDELAEVGFWKQNNGLVQGDKIYDTLRAENSAFTCAKIFWWYNMYSSADWSITPRPHYPADGRKVFDVYTEPMNLGTRIKEELGDFPFLRFWGPGAGIESSSWIARSARWIYERHQPTLSLVYLPHLDYPLQKFGPDATEIQDELLAIDDVVGDLLHFYEEEGVRVLIVSEYGITEVKRHCHPNRILREAGMLAIRPSLDWEMLDCGASDAFAVADHQIAHVYVKDPSRVAEVASLFKDQPGIKQVLHGTTLRAAGLDHRRSGNVVLMAHNDCWFTYYYWNDNDLAPDFARSVDIHRKPGYDPCELFLDPELSLPKLRIACTLAKKKLGFRYMMNVIPLDPTLVRGSHGTPVDKASRGPVALSRFSAAKPQTERIPVTAVHDLIAAHVMQG